MAKILMMAGSTVVVLSLLGFLVLLLKGRAVTKTSPVLRSLKALGIRPSEAEQRLCRQRVWVGNDTLMTPREQHFFRALLRHTSRTRWLLCPQVRVADIATLSPHIRPRSRTWWQLFRMASQWHCDVVIVDIHTFAIIGAVELDDASHQKKHRIRRDILLEEVLRQAGIPLLRDRDSESLVRKVVEFLKYREAGAEEKSISVMKSTTKHSEHKEKEKMIIAAEVKRDEQGYWTHPALVRSGCETSAELSYWLRTHKLQCFVMTMRDEAPEAFAAGFTDEAPDARGWIPEPPDDDGWFLGSVHDTGDGPVCYWFRHTTKS